jgi:3-isopropylmalate/(R)-2-methylmalate dehydratase small subunit
MVEVDLEKGLIRDLTGGKTYSFKPIPRALMEILREGGLTEYLRKAGDYKL